MRITAIIASLILLTSTAHAEWPEIFKFELPYSEWATNEVGRKTALIELSSKPDTPHNRNLLDKQWVVWVLEDGSTNMVFTDAVKTLCQVNESKEAEARKHVGAGATMRKIRRPDNRKNWKTPGIRHWPVVVGVKITKKAYDQNPAKRRKAIYFLEQQPDLGSRGIDYDIGWRELKGKDTGELFMVFFTTEKNIRQVMTDAKKNEMKQYFSPGNMDIQVGECVEILKLWNLVELDE